MDNNKLETYKIYQICGILISKYGYNQLMIKEYQSFLEKEAWLVNFNNPNYQIIRISIFPADQASSQKDRIEAHINSLKNEKTKNDKFNFLDIHISKDKYSKKIEEYDYLNIDDNYIDGIKIKKMYPEVTTCVKNSDNPDGEMMNYLKQVTSAIKEKRKKLPFLLKYTYFFTLVIIGLCIFNFVVSTFLQFKYDQSSVMLLLGADYKTLTLANHEYYRLITYAFVHSGIAHLFCNMVSLYALGKYIEPRFGHLNFLLILFTSVLAGSLTQGILTDNQLCVGMSAGIYGLFIVFIFDVIKCKVIDFKRLIPTILLNIMLNFLTSISWMSHLGGAIAAVAVYNALNKDKKFSKYILIICLILGLLIRYLSISKINTFYGGTDIEYINLLSKLGFNYDDLTQKFLLIYEKYGGLK